MVRRAASVLFIAALIAAATPSCRFGGGRTTTRLSIATGGTGGVYYVYGGALARVISRDLPGVEATAEVTSASVENLRYVGDGSADIAFTLADTAMDAVRGRGRFGHPLPVRALAVLYDNVTHVVTLEASGIVEIDALRGRRVSTGSPNSGTEVIAERVLRAAGIDPESGISRERLGAAESADALRDGRIDAFFWSGGLRTAAILELASSPGVKIRLLSDAHLVPRLVQEYGPLYAIANVPDGAYAGTRGAAVSTVQNLLVVNQAMPEPLAYSITRLLFDRKPELAAAHPAARELESKRAASGPLGYHPGAIRYYCEAGSWSEPR